MPSGFQVQNFGDIQIDGQGNTLTINQVVEIAVAEVKTHPFIASSPYVGLRRFEERTKDVFFGRDRVVAELLQLLSQRSLVLVAGSSGSGKSSVVRAGLLPQLARILPQGRFRALVLTPDRDPFSSLRSALQSAGVAQNQLTMLETRSAESMAAALTLQRPEDELWVLFVDQFEELFTLCADARWREAFLSGLTQLVGQQQRELKIVLAMRTDLIDQLGAYPRFGALAQQGLQLVLDMDTSDLRAAIEQPAAKHGVVFEAGLVEEIIADVKGRPGALPLLQYTLDLLWRADNPADDRTLNSVTYHRIGGIDGALRLRGDTLYAFSDPAKQTPRPAAQQELMRQIFLRLVDLTGPGAEARAVSRRARLGDFASAKEKQLIDELVDEKLLIASAHRTGNTGLPDQPGTVEIAHEALLSAWPRYKDWIEQARSVIYSRNRLAADAHRYAEMKADRPDLADEELWSGTRLQQALELRARGDYGTVLGGLSADQEAFLNASFLLRETRAKAEAARRAQMVRLRRLLLAGSSTAAATIIGLLTLGLVRQRSQTEVQRRLTQAAVAATALARDEAEKNRQRLLSTYVEAGRKLLYQELAPGKALLWLYRAQTQGSTNPGLPYLLKSARTSVGVGPTLTLQHDGGVRLAMYSADGRRILTVDSRSEPVANSQSGSPIRTADSQSYAIAWNVQSDRPIRTADSQDSATVWDAQSGRRISSLPRQDDAIVVAAIGPDGRQFATTSDKEADSAHQTRLVQLWDAETGAARGTLSGHTEPVLSIGYSPDGRRIVTASADKTARVWDATTGRQLWQLAGHKSGVSSAHYSQDGSRIITMSADGTVRLWDAGTGKLGIEIKGQYRSLTSAEYERKTGRVLTAGSGGLARIWDSQTGKKIVELSHTLTVTMARFSLDGRTVVTITGRTASLWDASSGQLLSQVKQRDTITSAAFSRNGTRLLVGGLDYTARLFTVRAGRLLWELDGHTGPLWAATYSPDGTQILTASADATVRIWPAESGRTLHELTDAAKEEETLVGATYNAAGDTLLIAGDDQPVQLWEPGSGRPPRLLSGDPRLETARGVMSPDGRRLLTMAALSPFNVDYAVRLWELQGTSNPQIIKDHKGDLSDASYSPDSKQIVTASLDGAAYVWDAKSGARLWELRGHGKGLTRVRYSPDGAHLLGSSSDGKAYEWSVAEKRLVREIPGDGAAVLDAIYDPTGQSIFTANSDRIPRVHGRAGVPVRRMAPHKSKFRKIQVSPDGKLLLIAGADGVVNIWDVESGRLLRELKGYVACGKGAGFSPDGRRIVTSFGDGVAYIWDAEDGALVDELRGHADTLTCAAYSPDGRRIVTTSTDRSVRIWDATPETLASAELARFIRCNVPFKFSDDKSDVLVPAVPDPAACAGPAR